MKSGSAKTARLSLNQRLAALVAEAASSLPPPRAEAMFRKWLAPADVAAMRLTRRMVAMADAVMLAADLVVSQPSALGSTALDRLAKNRAHDAGEDAPLLAALRRARYRLLRLEPAGAGDVRMACDVLSGEAISLPAAEFGPLPAGTPIFARIARLEDTNYGLAGAVTPLDEAAFAMARGHGAAGSTSVFGNARWAEAVFAHVVRHGTLEVPGINRPDDYDAAEDEFDSADDDHAALAGRWAALGEGAADAALLRQTREHACAGCTLAMLGDCLQARASRQSSLATGFERMLRVVLETMLRRERSGSVNTETLDDIAAHIEVAVAERRLPREARGLFAELRQRLGGATSKAGLDSPELARLMQRIQGLRAKTVGHGCTEQEALAAAEKVAELLDRYGLSLGELDFKAQPCEGVGVQTTRRRMAPIDNCVPAIAEFFDCRVWLEHEKGDPIRYIFFGVRTDVTAAQYLYELVERAFQTETDLFRDGPVYAAFVGDRRRAATSFQVGLGQGIRDKLRALQAARDAWRRSASGRDLVVAKAAVVDEELEKLGLSMRTRSTGGARRVLTDAYQAGQQAAERFDYTPGIERAA